MTALSRMFGSTVGRKYLVAVTGILLVLFLIGHLVGNLLLYAGRDAMNSYAQGLKNLGAGLWVIRAGLLAVFVVHISLAISLNLASKKARGVAYASPLKPQVSSFATRSSSASSESASRCSSSSASLLCRSACCSAWSSRG
jgi:succinate dehydrogenase / fumarate reductase cytochrome b subunit